MKKHELKSKLKLCEASNLKLLLDLDRLHRERDSFQEQARALADEVERLSSMLVLAEAIGERGDACLSIDGGNL